MFLRNLFATKEIEDPKVKYSLESMQKYVEEKINNAVISSIDEYGKSPQEIKDIRKRKDIFKTQLSLCGLGDIASKLYMKSWISDLLTQEYGVDEYNIQYAINFDFPSSYDKFCILLNKYFKDYRYDALKNFIKLNKLDTLKKIEDEEMFIITEEDIEDIFDREVRDTTKIRFYDKLSILVQRIYENTLGLSVIDEILDMNLETISIGLSGIPVDFTSKISDINIKNNENKVYPMSYNSVYVNIGKEILFQFMGFGSQRELERVCRRMYKFKNQRQFTQADGSIINILANFARANIFRPPHSETWAAIVRKYDVDGELDTLIVHENGDMLKEFISYVWKATENLCISGDQGVGKTTMLVGVLKKGYANKTIRCWEDYFETFFRLKKYFRNILTIRKTENIDGEKGLDNLKRSNGNITVISESADDRAKSYVIKGALAASEGVIWTDHSVGPDELVESHRNACLNIGLFRDEIKAEEQVLSVLKWNMQLENDEIKTERFVRRFTEFRRIYKNEYTSEKGIDAFHANAKVYFEMKTNARKYKAVNIFEFDEENRKYVVKNMISDTRKNAILLRLREDDRTGFLNLLERMKGEIVT